MPAMPSLSVSRCRASALRPVRTLAALALAGLAVACGPKDDQFAPTCPSLALLPDAADLSRFNGGGTDVTNLLVRARITGVPAACKKGDDTGTVQATLHVDADLTRGPASTAPVAPLSYFIALMEGNRVMEEQDFAFTPTFSPNVDRTTVHGDDIELVLPVSKKKNASAYQIYVGFRLTPDELAYNRTHPRP